jgi:tryptophanyl-tRNA synthetase
MNNHTVLSGIRATGRLHLGNYLGAVKGMLELQDSPDYNTYYMVADVHGITTPYSPEKLRTNRIEVIKDYLAAGLDPKKSVLFIQSEVPEHLELQFYFSSIMTVARMQHLPTFKEKAKQYPEHITMALLNYPVLMASDILVYKADSVPVGLDQLPHIEIAREVARKMNDQYGLNFPEPDRFETKGSSVPSLTGEGKMSKSVEGSYINLTDSIDDVLAKVKKIPTDTGKGKIETTTKEYGGKQLKQIEYISSESGESASGVRALFELVELFQGKELRESYESEYQTDGVRYGDVKTELAEAIYAEIKPVQDKRAELEKNSDYVESVIRDGAQKARTVAAQTVKEVKDKMGFS